MWKENGRLCALRLAYLLVLEDGVSQFPQNGCALSNIAVLIIISLFLAMRIKVTATRVSKASKDSIWKAVEDLESWPKWSDGKSKNHVISNKIVSREGNSVLCDTDEVANGLRVKHRGRITFYPREKLTEEMIEGPDVGFFTWNFTETPKGTRIDVSLDVEPKTLMFKIGFRLDGKRALQGMADEYNKQLSDYAEAHP